MLPRVLEPEVMAGEGEADEYNAMDHAGVNRRFAEDLLAALSASANSCLSSKEKARLIFDAGTGTALIPIEILRSGLAVSIMAADAAAEMLQVARRNIAAAGFSQEIEVVLRDCKQLPETNASFDVVISNSLLHHIPAPAGVLAECWRILKPGGLLFVRDLLRPDTASQVEQLVETYAGDQTPGQQQLLRQSLHAALTMDEVTGVLESTGIPVDGLARTSDRHWTLSVIKAV